MEFSRVIFLTTLVAGFVGSITFAMEQTTQELSDKLYSDICDVVRRADDQIRAIKYQDNRIKSNCADAVREISNITESAAQQIQKLIKQIPEEKRDEIILSCRNDKWPVLHMVTSYTNMAARIVEILLNAINDPGRKFELVAYESALLKWPSVLEFAANNADVETAKILLSVAVTTEQKKHLLCCVWGQDDRRCIVYDRPLRIATENALYERVYDYSKLREAGVIPFLRLRDAIPDCWKNLLKFIMDIYEELGVTIPSDINDLLEKYGLARRLYFRKANGIPEDKGYLFDDKIVPQDCKCARDRHFGRRLLEISDE